MVIDGSMHYRVTGQLIPSPVHDLQGERDGRRCSQHDSRDQVQDDPVGAECGAVWSCGGGGPGDSGDQRAGGGGRRYQPQRARRYQAGRWYNRVLNNNPKINRSNVIIFSALFFIVFGTDNDLSYY